VSGLLAFWPDFFALWTHGVIPYEPVLTFVLLIGTAAAAPSILAVGYASYSNQGPLLLRAKAMQLVLFLVLSAALIPSIGLLGAAIAVVASEFLVQFGVLGWTVIRRTLQHPLQHLAFLAAAMIAVTIAGWVLGTALRQSVPLAEPWRFLVEC